MKIEQKAVELLDKIENVVINYTPEVYETAIDVIWFDAIGSLTNILVCFLFSSLFGFLVYKAPAICDKYNIDPRTCDIAFFISVFFGGVSLILFLEGLISLFDYWMWIGIFNPELALAHKVMGL